ncbi:uncharacterized protein [Procambarus clarkii]|uniref:uncharacterized protein n=1 Tax=Procambarus clarkii TaxID=6728 RepID=UPI001E6778D9|nr:uncharacterized protein LOC123763603 [Procambarus clarkii]
MWKAVLLLSSASVVLQMAVAQSGAESLPFHGYIPGDSVRANAPRGDGQPNDIYLAYEKPPVLQDDEVVLYPRNSDSFGSEDGQDPEEHVYQIHKSSKLQNKFDKHSKHSHNHSKRSGKTLTAASAGSEVGDQTFPQALTGPLPGPNYSPPSAPHYPFPAPSPGGYHIPGYQG